MSVRTLPIRLLAIVIVAAWWNLSSVAEAQFQQSGNTGGLGGYLGGSSGGGLGTTAGGTQAGSGTGGMFGARNLGGSAAAGNRTMSGTTRNADSAGTLNGNERFVRANRQGQFVGGDSADVRNVFSTMGGQRNRGIQNLGMNSNQNQNPNDGMNDQGNKKKLYRTQRVIEFAYRPPTQAVLSSALGSRITKAVRIPGSKVDVLMQDRTAILQGSVPSAHARDLAAQLAMLEPGVSYVQNELVVAPPVMLAPPGTLSNGPGAMGPAVRLPPTDASGPALTPPELQP